MNLLDICLYFFLTISSLISPFLFYRYQLHRLPEEASSMRKYYGPLLGHTAGTVQYSIAQYSTVQCSTVQHYTIQYSTIQYSTVQHSAVQHYTIQYSTVQHLTTLTRAKHSAYQKFNRNHGHHNISECNRTKHGIEDSGLCCTIHKSLCLSPYSHVY